jgi:polyphosphate kinase
MPEDLRPSCERSRGRASDVFVLDGLLGLADTQQLIVDDRPDLKFPPYNAALPERIRDHGGDCFAAIRAEGHRRPPSLRELRRGGAVPAPGRARSQRGGDQADALSHLSRLADRQGADRGGRAGKSVTALVELKARFDEEANIRWARDLERAGVQVVYGFIELKTHAKVSWWCAARGPRAPMSISAPATITRSPPRSTPTCRFFTADPALGRDAARLFNYITGYAEPERLEKIASRRSPCARRCSS